MMCSLRHQRPDQPNAQERMKPECSFSQYVYGMGKLALCLSVCWHAGQHEYIILTYGLYSSYKSGAVLRFVAFSVLVWP